MMRLLHKFGACTMGAGLFVTMAGGMHIRRGPDGTWIQVNLVHGVGGGLMLCGMILSVLAAFAGGPRSAEPGAAPDRRGM
jgi:hypothetical protein